MDDFCNFIAGWGAGMIGLVIGHPMDTVKTNQQMMSLKLSNTRIATDIVKNEGIESVIDACIIYRYPRAEMTYPTKFDSFTFCGKWKHNNVVQLMLKFKSNEQFLSSSEKLSECRIDILEWSSFHGRKNFPIIHGLYKGMLFPLLCSGTLNSVFFGIYGFYLRNLQELRGHPSSFNLPTTSGWYLDTFVGGCVGGLGQVIIGCPRIYKPGDENNRKRRQRALLTGVDIYKKSGIRALYVGVIPMLWRDVLSSGLYIWLYQYTRFNFHGRLDLNPGPFETITAGGIAGLVSWIPVVPLDTIKSRIQADDMTNPFYKGMIHCCTHLLKEGGYINFFKGFQMIAFRSFIVNAAIFYAYESMIDCWNYI